MKPALSVIFLTVASGAGYGMLFWAGVLDATGLVPQAAWIVPAAVLIALALASAGLIASMFHLGRPERAWRAISQWRSSWLSREGLAALLTYIPALAFLVSGAFAGPDAALSRALGLVAALAAAVTVACTGMIYASLKPIRQWHAPGVLRNYMMMAAFSGALCVSGLGFFWQPPELGRAAAALAVLAGLGALAGKLNYWRRIDNDRGATTIEAATGLGALGPVRMLEAPNTEENYLLREFGFRIGRKHAGALRRIALILGFAVPLLLAVLGAILAGLAGKVLLPVAAIGALAGLFVERWLFFAQATHTVMLYYGQPRA